MVDTTGQPKLQIKKEMPVCPDCKRPVDRVYAVEYHTDEEASGVIYSVSCHGEDFQLIGLAE